ncbi:hypothetical protein KSS94_22550 [Pseudomonas fakonensis]|uniref:Uncharacterized protein n=1 Tax=Pseudomonas fakonensis TaxID=2842355 RepID=A0ABX8N301_9PSED|nr:hypothetical protein [Pseudomonas fakonensis]QXH50694.1 hypothetical protein KSS94_22550 [Pseudomonas fakonensis]
MKKQKAKPLLVAAFKAEAQRLGGSISANQRRFMAAAKLGRQMEPTGVMAGCA